MEVICQANPRIFQMLKKFNRTGENYRLLKYCVHTRTDDGILLLNLLTREMLLLSESEFEYKKDNAYLKEHMFLVPEVCNEREYADFVKWMMATMQKQSKNITHYTIFPTTDCNARCFYCFELGRSRIPMSEETAKKTAAYIKAHCGGNEVGIKWFGGEPLYNLAAIDTISDELARSGITFKAHMVSNGYLFDEELVRKAVEKWHVTRVQITLDGTERVYNKIKAYIYKEGNPYRRVLHNIRLLLDAGISVQIRLNLDLHNADDLLMLVDEIGEQFQDRKGLYVYAHHLFSANSPMAMMHSDEEWDKRDAAMRKLENKMDAWHLSPQRGVAKSLKRNNCMADSDSSVTILPDGNIGVCEHFSENEFIGHLDKEDFDSAVVASWKEKIEEIPACADCFYYPECTKLKKCVSNSVCFAQIRNDHLNKTKRAMRDEYWRWKNKTTVETVDDELC